MKILEISNPRTRAAVVIAVMLVPLLSFAAWYMTVPREQDDFPVILEHYGYSAMALPSRLFGPGSIITVETLRSGALNLHLACRIDDADLEQKWHNRSPAMEMSFTAGVKRTFKSSALAHNLIEYGLFGERANATDLSLQDIIIVTLRYDDLIALRSKYLREACEKAVVWNLRHGAKVCQSEEVLQADVVYRNEAKDRIDSNVKLEPIEAVRTSTHIDRDGTSKRTGKGDDLFLRIKVRLNHCFTLTENGRELVGSLCPGPSVL